MLRASTAVAGAAGISAVAQTELAYAKSAGQTTTVTIKRDEYGVPHIYAREADSRAPVFYGFGYATAKDRLYQLELYKRYYRGTVAEVIGEGDENNDWVQFDKEARRNTAGEESLDKQAEKQMTSEQRKMLQAFTDGINRYIREVHNSDDREFHKGFSDNDFEPEEFSFADSAGMFVSTMSYFSGTQLETLGAALVEALERETGSRERAMELFRDCNWGDDPGAPTSTVQPEVGYHPPYVEANSVSKSAPTYERRGKTGKLNDSTNKVTGGNTTTPANAQKVHETEMNRIQTLASGLDDLGLAMKYGSNALAVQGELTESGDALLFGGPQMGFNTPSVMYEAGLHGPDFDVTGSTVAGYPFIMFGHNQNGAFTSTAGLDNSIQTFVESITVNEDEPDTYTFRGDEHEIETEEKTIAVKDGDDVTYTERFTRHGVITTWDPENDQAIAQTRSYAGKHMRCLRAYLEAQLAGGVDEFEQAAQRCDYSLNFFWAGKCGDIGYFHLGRYPDAESVEWDTRLPADGTQYELTDDDYLRAADGEVPHAINPAPGYIANWNNKPAPNWDSGDLSYFWSTHHRVQRIINLVEHSLEENGSVNYELLKGIIYDISFVDRRALRYKPHLLSALDDVELDEIEQQAKAELESWENYRQGEGEDFTGKYNAGFTIWDATFPKIIEEVFSDDFGQAYELASNFLNYSYGQGTLMRVLHSDEAALTPNVDYVDGDPDDELIAAFRSAVSELSDTYDGAPSSWRTEAHIADLNNMALFGMPIGVSDAGDMPWVNRGTENHIVQLSDDPKAENVLPPGNDGYIAPDGTTSEHYNDQLQLFIDFEYKQLLFADEEVNAATESTRKIVVWPEDSPDNRSDDAPGNRSHDDAADGTPGFTAVTGAGAGVELGSALLWLRRRTGGR